MSVLHFKCRNSTYPHNPDVKRSEVLDMFVNWFVFWPDYKPLIFTSPSINNKDWADPDIQLSLIIHIYIYIVRLFLKLTIIFFKKLLGTFFIFIILTF